MNKYFYIEGSDEYYFGKFWEQNRLVLNGQNAVMLSREEANKLNVCDFFTKSAGDNKPRLNRAYEYLSIPSELDDDVYFDECKLIDSIVELANKNLQNEKFLASTDNDKCCVVKAPLINTTILWAIASGNLNTPFIIFDKRRDFFLLLDYDLPIQIVGYKRGTLSNKEIELWKEFFYEQWPLVLERYSNYQNLQAIVQKYYHFIETPQRNNPGNQ